MRWYEKAAEKFGMHVNPDEHIVELTLKGLERKKLDSGVRFCPCRIEKTLDNVCPCLAMRREHECCCGLFVK